MEQNKMTPFPWRIEYGDEEARDQIISDTPRLYANLICSSPDKVLDSYKNFKSNAEAIVSAVNNTYGHGINPEAVKDLLHCVESLMARLSLATDNNPTDWAALNEAKAAVEKTKL